METPNVGGDTRPKGALSAVCERCKGVEGAVVLRSRLLARVFRKDGSMEDLGVIAQKCVTTAFVNKLVDAFQAAAYVNSWKYHDSGTGTGNEAVGDTTLGTPCGEARDSGTQVEGASANIYKSVATHTYAGTFAITEHGLFDAATVGTLMDRSKFSAINVNSGDKIEFTYELTCTAGG
jgi:hypothetical protein